MTHIIDHCGSSIAVIVAGIFGSKVAIFFGDVAADVSRTPIPDYLTALQGPFGALVGLAIGLYWMSKRLNKAEAKADRREDERDADRKTLITVIEQNSLFLKQNGDTLSEVKMLIKK